MLEKASIGRTMNLEAEAQGALEETRAMPQSHERTMALKKAGNPRNAADLVGLVFEKRGRPRKD
jgi:hypothetical protein